MFFNLAIPLIENRYITWSLPVENSKMIIDVKLNKSQTNPNTPYIIHMVIENVIRANKR